MLLQCAAVFLLEKAASALTIPSIQPRPAQYCWMTNLVALPLTCCTSLSQFFSALVVF